MVSGADRRKRGAGKLRRDSLILRVAEKFALLPDYALPGSDSPLGTTVAGIVGALLCAVILGVCAYVILRKTARRGAAK